MQKTYLQNSLNLSSSRKRITKIKSDIQDLCSKIHRFTFNPKNPIVRLHEPTFSAEEINVALECLLSTKVTMGEQVHLFEKEFAQKHQMKHAVMVNSGSSANLLAFAALANKHTPNYLQPGDEVIVPALSWSTSVWPIIQNGLVPVIVDINPSTLNIDINEIDRAITKKSRAILALPVYGNPCDMQSISQLADKYNLLVIEDACEALGAKYKNKPVGSFGIVSTFSLYYSHHITTLEGGMCLTNNDDLAELMRILRAHGWVRDVDNAKTWIDHYPSIDPKFLFVNLGFNLRATELQGCIGRVQLQKLNSFIELRRHAADLYRKYLSKHAAVLDFQEETLSGLHSWFGFPLLFKSGKNINRDSIMQSLAECNIEARPIICGNIAKQPGLKDYKHRVVGDLQIATNVMNNALSIGCHHYIDEQAVSYVEKKLTTLLRK